MHMHAKSLRQNNKDERRLLLKKYTSHFIWKCSKGLLKVLLWEGVEDRAKTATYWPPLLWPSVFLSRSSGAAQPEARGAPLSAECWLSLPPLVINSSDLQLTDFLSPPSYIIVSIAHSISLEWHVWSSSSGNNCHAVHRSLSSGESVYDCTMEFYLVPYCRPSQPTRFLPINAIGMCHFLPVNHFGMACLAGSKVNIQHKLNCKRSSTTSDAQKLTKVQKEQTKDFIKNSQNTTKSKSYRSEIWYKL